MKRLLFSIFAGMQLPIAYYLNGHDLFERAKGLGFIYIFSIYITLALYVFFGSLPFFKK